MSDHFIRYVVNEMHGGGFSAILVGPELDHKKLGCIGVSYLMISTCLQKKA
jgi:hypothetical protein